MTAGRDPGGQTVKFWKDGDVYVGNQLPKGDSGRCYGVTADADHLLVCVCGENGSNPEIVVYQKRQRGNATAG